MSELRKYLANAYGGPADHRCKNLEQDRPIKIDDQNDHDVHRCFCSLSIRVPDARDDMLNLSIQYVPITSQVRTVIEEQGGTIREIPYGHNAEIPLNLKSIPFIRQLARSIRSIIGRGKRYDNPDWKWQCPRTAASLDRFAQVIKTYNAERRLATGSRRSFHSPSREQP
jgi:hypothetical protein